MDNFIQLYTRTDGRIARKTFWLGVVGLIVANLVLGFVLLPLFGLGVLPNITGADVSNPEAIAAAVGAASRMAAWGGLALLLILAWPTIALSLKRRHDRNSKGLDVLVFYGLHAFSTLLQALGLGLTTATVDGIAVPVPSMLLTVLSVIVGLLGLYLLVVLGFLKGTTGPNQFGPDPVTAQPASSKEYDSRMGNDYPGSDLSSDSGGGSD